MDQAISSLIYRFNGWGLVLYVLIVTLVAGLLSGVIGIEREMKGQAAGFRTHVLLSVGCALLMVVSIFGIGLVSGQIDLSTGAVEKNLVSYDTSRIAAGILAGLGFVCAGTIIRTGLSVRGLTTAATLWVCAGIGMACGSGLILEAIVVDVVTVALLSGLLYIEKAIGKRSPQIKFTVQKNLAMVRDLRSQADANGLIVKNISTHIVIAKDGTEATVIKVLVAMHSNQAALEEYCESFSNREGVLKVEKVHFRDVTSE